MYFICKVICKCVSGFWLWRDGYADLTLRGSVESAASLGARSWSLNTFLKSRKIHHPLPLTGCLLLLLSSFPNIYFTYLAALSLSCDLWDLFPWPEIKPGPPVLGACSLSHWTTREVPVSSFLMKDFTHPCQGTRMLLRHITFHSCLGSFQCF